MELHLSVLKERTKYIPGAVDFGAAAWRGHGFHTRPAVANYIYLLLRDNNLYIFMIG